MAPPAIEQNSNARVLGAPEQELVPPASAPKGSSHQQKRQKNAAEPAPKDVAAHADPPLALSALKTLMRDADADFAARRQVCEAYCALAQSLVDKFSGTKFALQRGHAIRVADLVTAAVARGFSSLASPAPLSPASPPDSPPANCAYLNDGASLRRNGPEPPREALPPLTPRAAHTAQTETVSWADRVARVPDPAPPSKPASSKRAKKGITPPQPGVSKPSKGKAGRAADDLRVLLRVSSLARRGIDLYDLRTTICSRLGLEQSAIRSINRTPTGFSIATRDLDIRTALLSDEMLPHLLDISGADTATLHQEWVTYVVQNVPLTINTVFDGAISTADVMLEEVEHQTGVKPVEAHPARSGPRVATNTCTWIVYFLSNVKSFRVFESNFSQLKRNSARVAFHADGCLGYCETRRCMRTRRCPQCSVPENHHPQMTDEGCTARVQCANCCGPHRSGHKGCRAAPQSVDGAPPKPKSRAALKRIRNAGKQDFAKQQEAEALPQEMESTGAPVASSLSAGDGDAALPSRKRPYLATQSNLNHFVTAVDAEGNPLPNPYRAGDTITISEVDLTVGDDQLSPPGADSSATSRAAGTTPDTCPPLC